MRELDSHFSIDFRNQLSIYKYVRPVVLLLVQYTKYNHFRPYRQFYTRFPYYYGKYLSNAIWWNK